VLVAVEDVEVRFAAEDEDEEDDGALVMVALDIVVELAAAELELELRASELELEDKDEVDDEDVVLENGGTIEVGTLTGATEVGVSVEVIPTLVVGVACVSVATTTLWVCSTGTTVAVLVVVGAAPT
jgi:hypothetical protein